MCVLLYLPKIYFIPTPRDMAFLVQYVLQGSLKPRVLADIMYTIHELPCTVTQVCKIINNIYSPVWWATQMSANAVWLTHFIRSLVGILTASSRYRV